MEKSFFKEHKSFCVAMLLAFVTFLQQCLSLWSYNGRPVTFKAYVYDILFYIIVFWAIHLIKNRKIRRTVFLFVFLVLNIAIIADTLYTSYYSFYAPMSVLKNLGQVIGIKEVDIGDIGLRLNFLAYFHLTVMVLGIWFCSLVPLNDQKRERQPVQRQKRPNKFVVFFVAFSLILSSNAGFVYGVRNKKFESHSGYYKSSSFLYNEFYNPNKFVSEFGYINMRIRDLAEFFGIIQSDIKTKDIDAFFADKAEKQSNSMTSTLKDKNVITVLAETFDVRTMEFFPELFPNFKNRLADKSMVLTNYYTPTYPPGATINSTMMAIGSQYPVRDSYFSNMASDNAKNDFKNVALPGQLKNQGYATTFMHANIKKFYSRDEFFPNLGFENLITTEDADDADIQSNIQMDENLLDLLDAGIAAGKFNFSEKFYLDIATYSAHGGHESWYEDNTEAAIAAFKRYYKRTPDLINNKTDYLFVMFLNKLQSFDKFFGKLLDRLQTEGVLQDTVILVYPDHYNYVFETNGKRGAYEKYFGISTQNMELAHQKLFIFDGGKQVYEEKNLLGSTIDITPTLLNMLEADHTDKMFQYKYLMGMDIFDQENGQINGVVFNDLTFTDGTLYINIDGSYYTNKAGLVITEAYTDKLYEQLTDKLHALQIQRQIYKKDYYKGKTS